MLVYDTCLHMVGLSTTMKFTCHYSALVYANLLRLFIVSPRIDANSLMCLH